MTQNSIGGKNILFLSNIVTKYILQHEYFPLSVTLFLHWVIKATTSEICEQLGGRLALTYISTHALLSPLL